MDRRFKPMTPAEQVAARLALYAYLDANPGLPLADTLRAIRRHLRLTVAEMARLSGLSSRFISQIEHGQGNPTVQTVHQLLAPFGLSLGVVRHQPAMTVSD